MLSHRTLQYLLVSGFVLQAGACEEASSGDLLEKQRQRWRSERPERFVVQICQTETDDACERLAVDGEMVVAAQIGARGGGWLSIDEPGAWQEPLARLFDAARERERDCILKRLEFEAEYGFVGEYLYQCRDQADDHGQVVVCFVPDADSLQACDASS